MYWCGDKHVDEVAKTLKIGTKLLNSPAWEALMEKVRKHNS
jgi:superfamily II RNA helicase